MSRLRRVAQRRGDAFALVRARWHLRGAELGERVRLRGRPVVISRGDLVIHDRVQIVSTVAQLELVAEAGGRLEIGSRSLINFGCSIVALDRVTIGERCLIGPHCMIMDTGFHHVDPARRLDPPESNPITIEDNVWLGARVIVFPGVTIGENSVVGIGSIVTSDVPPNTVVAGNPARHIRSLDAG
ncbi:MAG: DapH/DapD/GlmU-related protein [Ilumatobacter sp.]|uniref:DapH/DapD/GlmU-related protein n=1 Tax=Ilumatobacter sp. TaxID=1967498 RepID=UPI003C756328